MKATVPYGRLRCCHVTSPVFKYLSAFRPSVYKGEQQIFVVIIQIEFVGSDHAIFEYVEV